MNISTDATLNLHGFLWTDKIILISERIMKLYPIFTYDS